VNLAAGSATTQGKSPRAPWRVIPDFLWVKVAFGDNFSGHGAKDWEQPTKPAQIDTLAAGGFLIFLFSFLLLEILI
jgi:hypothetical protein